MGNQQHKYLVNLEGLDPSYLQEQYVNEAAYMQQLEKCNATSKLHRKDSNCKLLMELFEQDDMPEITPVVLLI